MYQRITKLTIGIQASIVHKMTFIPFSIANFLIIKINGIIKITKGKKDNNGFG